MKHILVATDGSEAAARAVDEAAALAAALDIELTVCHVLHFGRPAEELARMAEVEHMVRHAHETSGLGLPRLPDSMPALFKETRPGDDSVRLVTVIGEEIVDRAADRATELGARTVGRRTVQGDTADAILDLAEEVGADAIAIGHRGLGRIRRALLGSVAQKIVSQAPCTVISVR